MARLLVALPPSEGKQIGGRGAWEPSAGRFGATLGPARIEVADRLGAFARRASAATLASFFGVGGAHLERAVESARSGLVGTPVLPALDRYTGVVWEHLALGDASAATRRWAARNVVVVSGLLGVVAAGDPVPDYRLKMAAKLPGIGPLAPWWKTRIAAALSEHARGATVVDLLPKEHAGAFDADATGRAPIVVRFQAATGAHAAGHAAKAAKGVLARALVEARAEDPATVCRTASVPGFRWADEQMTAAGGQLVTMRASGKEH